MVNKEGDQVDRSNPNDDNIIYISSEEDDVSKERILSPNVVGFPKSRLA